MIVIKQKIHTQLIINNLCIVIEITRLRSYGDGVMDSESRRRSLFSYAWRSRSRTLFFLNLVESEPKSIIFKHPDSKPESILK